MRRPSALQLTLVTLLEVCIILGLAAAFYALPYESTLWIVLITGGVFLLAANAVLLSSLTRRASGHGPSAMHAGRAAWLASVLAVAGSLVVLVLGKLLR